jgi:hypothetical protein
MTHDATGTIAWVDNFNDAKTFYRVKGQALVPGTTEKYEYDIMFLSTSTDIKSPTTRVLYKNPETQEVSFVQMADIKTSFDDALILFTDATSLTSEVVLGSKEIEYNVINQPPETDYYIDCLRECNNNPNCMGYNSSHQSWFGGCKRWGYSRICDFHKYSCKFYLKDENSGIPVQKTDDVKAYRRPFYGGVGY